MTSNLTDHRPAVDDAEPSRDSVLADYGLPDLQPHVAAAGTDTPDTLDQLHKLLTLATRITRTPYGMVNIITEGARHQIAAVGLEPGICSVEDSLCGAVFLRGQTTVVPDASRDPLFQNNPFVTGAAGAVRFYASVPLTTASGFVLGSLCVLSPVPGELPRARRAYLEIIASQVVAVLELHHHARMLAVSLADARRSNELLTSFAGRISHELRNPLTSVLGFAELGEERTPAAADDFAIIGRTSRRMLGRVDDMLAFSRIGGDVRRQPVSLAALVHDVEEDLARLLQDAAAEITVADVHFDADAGQLRTLLQNLIHNAVAYCRPGTAPRILVTAEKKVDELTIRVADNGKGIPAEDRDRVTEPLIRLHRDGDPPGSGFGLATCVRIAGAHGGHLEIGEGPDGGTVVSLRMPLDIPPTAAGSDCASH